MVPHPQNGNAASKPLQPIYTTYMGGIGGPCARYDPPFSYWCSDKCMGGGAHITEVCRGVTPPKSAISPPGGNATAGLHMPYVDSLGWAALVWHRIAIRVCAARLSTLCRFYRW